MAKKPIEQMTYEELRAEVKLMSDDMARMKRTYEDLLYNLDMSNFSGQFVKEANGVKSSITQTAEEIKAEVQRSTEALDGKIKDNAASIKLTADAIQSEVTARETADDGLNEQITKVTQTAESIQTEVSSIKKTTSGLSDRIDENKTTITQTAENILAEVVKLQNDVEMNKASIEVNAEAITSKVEKKYVDEEVKGAKNYVDDAVSGAVDGMNTTLEEYSKVEQTAQAIQSMVLKRVDLKRAEKVLEEDWNPLSANTDMIYCVQVPLRDENDNVIYVTNEDDKEEVIPISETYWYFNTELNKWAVLEGDNIYTVFEQTADGFKMRGNVRITGDLVSGGTITGVSIGTSENWFGDCIRLNSKTNSLEFYWSNQLIAWWKFAMTGDRFGTGLSGTEDYPLFFGHVDFSGAKINWGNNQPVCVFGTDE